MLLFVFGAMILTGCASGENSPQLDQANQVSGLSATQLEMGIGPISEVELAALDVALAEKGGEIFNTKCAMCHKFDQRYVGPSLAGLLDRRTPAFVLNMMLNPAEMVEKHPEVKQMLGEFLTPMPDQNLSEADARAILEYIRQETQEEDR